MTRLNIRSILRDATLRKDLMVRAVATLIAGGSDLKVPETEALHRAHTVVLNDSKDVSV